MHVNVAITVYMPAKIIDYHVLWVLSQILRVRRLVKSARRGIVVVQGVKRESPAGLELILLVDKSRVLYASRAICVPGRMNRRFPVKLENSVPLKVSSAQLVH